MAQKTGSTASPSGNRNIALVIAISAAIVLMLGGGGWFVYDQYANQQALQKGLERELFFLKKDKEEKAAAEVETKRKDDERKLAEGEAAKKVAEEEAKKKLAAAGMGGRKPPPDYASERALLDSGERAGERLAAMEAGDVRPLGRHPQDAAADRDRAIVLDNFIPDTSLVFGRVKSKFNGAVRYDVNHQVQQPPQLPRFPHPDPRIPTPITQPVPCTGCGGGSPPTSSAPAPPASGNTPAPPAS